MAGLGIGNLPWPERRYRVDLHVPTFETEEDAAVEDYLRAAVLRTDGGRHGGDWGRSARALADQLDPDLNPEFPVSPASARYWRDQRIRISGALLKLIDNLGRPNVRRCDIIRTSWNLDLDAFIDEDPARLKNELRSTIVRAKAALYRKGIETTGRFIFAALHGEFNPEGLTYQLHYHVVEEHEDAVVIDSLRDRKGFIAPRRADSAELGEADGHVAIPVRITRTPITNLPYALGYLIKSYWLQYLRTPTSAGSKKISGKGQRIETPYLSVQLLWLHQFRISDLIFMNGLRVTRDGLILNRPVHE